MKALTITNKSVTREALLEMTEKVQGAWIGIRIAALLLVLEGWKSSQIVRLFGLTRWSVVRWMQGVNDKGVFCCGGKETALLVPILHKGDIGMESVAERLGLSRQTLYRNLKSEGVTHETVLDELRHKMSLNYLAGRKVSVNETAYLVGFSEPAAFSRAFKRWTGKSPSTA